MMIDKMDKKALLNVKEMCEYLGIGQTKARELLADPKNSFTVRIGNRLYAHKGRLDTWLLEKCGVNVFAIYTKRHAEMVEKFKVLW